MAVQTSINGYNVKVTYEGIRASPMDPDDTNCNIVNIENSLTGNNTYVMLWRPEVTDPNAALYTFYCVLQGVLFGALNPTQFCATFGLQPSTDAEHEKAEVMFLFFREITARLAPLINTKKELAETMRMIEQKLGLDPKKMKQKGKRHNGHG